MCWPVSLAISMCCAKNGVTRERNSRRFRRAVRSWPAFVGCGSHGAIRTRIYGAVSAVPARSSNVFSIGAENAPALSAFRDLSLSSAGPSRGFSPATVKHEQRVRLDGLGRLALAQLPLGRLDRCLHPLPRIVG